MFNRTDSRAKSRLISSRNKQKFPSDNSISSKYSSTPINLFSKGSSISHQKRAIPQEARSVASGMQNSSVLFVQNSFDYDNDKQSTRNLRQIAASHCGLRAGTSKFADFDYDADTRAYKRDGKTVFQDCDRGIYLSEIDEAALEAAVRLYMQKYGSVQLKVICSSSNTCHEETVEKLLQVIVKNNLDIQFADPKLEIRKLELIKAAQSQKVSSQISRGTLLRAPLKLYDFSTKKKVDSPQIGFRR